MSVAQRRLRVVVCGTTFGRVYLRGLALLPECYEVAGILARGSRHSVEIARQYGVPLYTGLDQLPDEGIDAACVVVRSAVVGGGGGDLALALLERGLHVLQEHPVHHDEMAACLRMARRQGRVYRLNTFYPDVAPVSRFIAAARRIQALRQTIYVDAACSVQVLFPLVDILGQALGGLRPCSVWAAGQGEAAPFTMLGGLLSGVPLSLRVQNEMHPGDPDNHTHLLHRITIGGSGGALTLVDTHGPVSWSPRLHVGRDAEGILQMFSGDESLALPSTSILGPSVAPSFDAVFTQEWPEAMARALRRFHCAILDGDADPAHAQYHLGVCRVWQDIGQCLGPVRLVSPPPPAPLSAAALAEGIL